MLYEIDGNTELIAHIGYPTHTFKSPMIYNPFLRTQGVNAVVVPMGCQPLHYPQLLKSVFALTNIRGALITMPHKVATVGLVDLVSPTVRVAGACNAVKRLADGRLMGDMFDGAGFVLGVKNKGLDLVGAQVLVVGCGGVGSAIAASLAAEGIASIRLFDAHEGACEALAQRIQSEYPAIEVVKQNKDPAGLDLVVNASPLGMNEDDPLPIDMDRLDKHTFVGEVVMRSEMTPFLHLAKDKGCRFQVGADMLFEQIPAYLAFFDLPTTDAQTLRNVAQLKY